MIILFNLCNVNDYFKFRERMMTAFNYLLGRDYLVEGCVCCLMKKDFSEGKSLFNMGDIGLEPMTPCV